MSMASRIAFASGPECLGATELPAYDISLWRESLGGEVILEPIDLGSLQGLKRLWNYQGLILISDGCYDEAAQALTLSTIFEWCRRGGLLASVGVSPFLAAKRQDGTMRASSLIAIDVAETFIGDNRKESVLALTDLGRRLPQIGFLPGTLLELNRGSVPPLALHAISPVDEPFITTEHGDAVLGMRRVGEGHWITWAAAARPQHSRAVSAVTSPLIRQHLPKRTPVRATAVLDQLSRADGEEEVLIVQIDGAGRSVGLLDEDSGESWEAKADLDGVATFRIPASGEARSLRAAIDGVYTEFTVVYPGLRLPEQKPPAPTEPHDFDGFWTDRLRELKDCSPEVDLAQFPEFSSDSVAAYRVRFTGWLGETVTGTLTRPRSGSCGSLLTFPGYMAAGLQCHPWPLAEKHMILSVDVRRAGSVAGELPITAEGMLTHQLETPARSGMVGAVMDAVRAYDLLNSIQGEERGVIGVYGASHGGALALAVAALRESVGAVASAAPFLMNIRNEYSRVGTEPYLELQRYANRGESARHAALEALDFVDSAHFLRRVRQPALVVITREDDVAPARGIETWGLPDNIDLRIVDGDHITPAFVEMRTQIFEWLDHQIAGLARPSAESHDVPDRPAAGI